MTVGYAILIGGIWLAFAVAVVALIRAGARAEQHNRAIRRRLAEIEAQRPWGEVVEFPRVHADVDNSTCRQ